MGIPASEVTAAIAVVCRIIALNTAVHLPRFASGIRRPAPGIGAAWAKAVPMVALQPLRGQDAVGERLSGPTVARSLASG